MPIHPLIKNKPIKVDTYDELVKLEIWNRKDVCIMLKANRRTVELMIR